MTRELDALREALDWIDKYEEAIGHSYCDLNVGGGWASDECTCGFGDKMAGWRAALAPSTEATGEGRRWSDGLTCTCTIHEDRGEPCPNPVRICIPCERDCWGLVPGDSRQSEGLREAAETYIRVLDGPPAGPDDMTEDEAEAVLREALETPR